MKAAIVGIAGPVLSPAEAALFRDHPPAGVILFARNIQTPRQVTALLAELRRVLPPQAVFMVDQEGGRVARLRPPGWNAHPPAAALGTVRRAWLGGALIGLDCAGAGFNTVAAPVLDLSIPGAHDVIGDRALAEDPSQVARLGRAFAEGLLAAGMQPVGKHVPGHGRARVDSHLALPVVEANDLDADFLPFARNADLPWMMTAHIVYPALDPDRPATLSPVIVGEIIRRRMGFQGVLVTDDLAMKALRGEPADLAITALAAGCDLALYCAGDYAATASLLARCPVPTEAATGRLARARTKAAHARLDLDAVTLARERDGMYELITNFFVHAALAIIPVVLAITLHEAAHGYAALALGDTTARDQGRLSLNPLNHIDRTGTIILPGILLISQLLTIGRVAFMFGWAKPVPVSAWKFAKPRQGMALVAAAGPAMNFFLAWATAIAMRLTADADIGASWTTVLFDFMLINIVLGLFNLLPIPPLDGGRVVAGFLSDDLARVWGRLERFGLVIVLAALLILPNVFGVNPVGDALEVILPKAFRLIFWLAGYHE